MTLHFGVLLDFDCSNSSLIEYYMIDCASKPVNAFNENGKSIMYVKNESYVYAAQKDCVYDGDLYDVVEKYRVSFFEISGNSSYYSVDFRAERTVTNHLLLLTHHCRFHVF